MTPYQHGLLVHLEVGLHLGLLLRECCHGNGEGGQLLFELADGRRLGRMGGEGGGGCRRDLHLR